MLRCILGAQYDPSLHRIIGGPYNTLEECVCVPPSSTSSTTSTTSTTIPTVGPTTPPDVANTTVSPSPPPSTTTTKPPCICNQLNIQFRTYTIPDGLIVTAGDNQVLLDTGSISTGDDYYQTSLTNIPCNIRLCVYAPLEGTKWDLICTGCVSMSASGGQNQDGIPACFSPSSAIGGGGI